VGILGVGTLAWVMTRWVMIRCARNKEEIKIVEISMKKDAEREGIRVARVKVRGACAGREGTNEGTGRGRKSKHWVKQEIKHLLLIERAANASVAVYFLYMSTCFLLSDHVTPSICPGPAINIITQFGKGKSNKTFRYTQNSL